jgi:hypothetical protein
MLIFFILADCDQETANRSDRLSISGLLSQVEPRWDLIRRANLSWYSDVAGGAKAFGDFSYQGFLPLAGTCKVM